MGNNQIKEPRIEHIISQIKSLKQYTLTSVKPIIEKYITKNNINNKLQTGETFLLWCIGNFTNDLLLNIVNMLLDIGADPNMKGTLNINKNLYIFTESKYYKESMNKIINISPLYALTRQFGNEYLYQTILSLIMYGAKIDFGFTSFIHRYRFHNNYDFEIFKFLVENGLNVKSDTIVRIKGITQSRTPIIILTQFGLENTDYYLQLDILKFMIDKESNLSFETSDGITFWSLIKDEYIRNDLISYIDSKNNKNKKTNNLFIAKECLICYREDKDLCLTTCSHAVCCMDCISDLPNRKCPYCNKEIQINKYQLIKFIAS